jgi:urease accessory protein
VSVGSTAAHRDRVGAERGGGGVRLGGKNVWRIPAAFVGAMAVGAVLGVLEVRLPHTALGIAGSVLMLGLGIVFADRRVSPWPITALVSFFGVCHGHAHGVEIPNAVSPALYTLGFLISTSRCTFSVCSSASSRR